MKTFRKKVVLREKRGQKGGTAPFFLDRYFPAKTYSDEKTKTCDMMLSISPCISAYSFNEK